MPSVLKGAQSFLLGIWFRRGYCYASVMEVSEPQYEEWDYQGAGRQEHDQGGNRVVAEGIDSVLPNGNASSIREREGGFLWLHECHG